MTLSWLITWFSSWRGIHLHSFSDSLAFFSRAGHVWIVPKLIWSIEQRPFSCELSTSWATDLWQSPATSCMHWRSGTVQGFCSCSGYARWMCVQKEEMDRVALASTVYCPVCSLPAYCLLVYRQCPWPGSSCLHGWGLKSYWGECGCGLKMCDPVWECDFSSGATDRTHAACLREKNKHFRLS